MRYIGIRGHRGAGKSSVAYLLGCIIEFILNERPIEEYDNYYKELCKNIRIGNLDAELNNVIYERFGDTPKMLVSMLTGLPLKDLNDPAVKDGKYINIKTFDITESTPDNLETAESYFNTRKWTQSPEVINDDVYMTIREFILYFGVYIMQNAFGLNVWIKSMKVNSKYFEGLWGDDQSGYKIFPDVKARSEAAFIKDKDGIVIKVNRNGHKKPGGMDLLRGCSVYDYEITYSELEDMKEDMYNIANNIINHDTI